ncbi:MAG TPA: stage V sporulation protein B [Clostridia bacterium]|nr:stage V sporulation protein B [Clostridia bacterium]
MRKHSVLHGIFILTISNILVQLLGFVYRILLSRSIGPEGMEILHLIMPVLSISLALVSAGVPLAVSRLVAQRKVMEDRSGVRRVLFTALGLVITTSLFACIILIMNINWIVHDILKEPRTRGALFVLYPIIIIMAISGVLKGYFHGVKDFYPTAYSDVLENIVRIVLVFYIIRKISHMDISIQVAIVVLVMVIGELSSLLYLNYCYHKFQKFRPLSQRKAQPIYHPLMDILKISLPLTLIRLISSLSNSVSSILIPQRLVVSGMTHSDAISRLGMLSGMVAPLLFLPFIFTGSLSLVIVPNLSEDLTQKNWNGIRSKISKTIFITTITALPFGAILVSLADPIGLLLYKQKEVGSMLQFAACSVGLHTLSFGLRGVLNGLGKQSRVAIFSFLGEIFEIGCTYFLVALPNVRIYGYIIGFSLSSFIVLALGLNTIRKTTNLAIRWGEWFIKPGFASLLTASITRLLYLWAFNGGFPILISFFIAALTGIFIYISALYLMGSISFVKELFFPSKLV